MKKATIFLLGIILFFPFCKKTENKPKEPENKQKKVLSQTSESSLLNKIEMQYKLKPDKRIIAAFRNIEKFIGGKSTGEIKTILYKNKWYFFKGEKQLWTLSEIPSYNEFMNILVSQVKEISKTNGFALKQTSPDNTTYKIMDKKIDDFLSINLFIVLNEINNKWQKGERTPELIRLAAKAYTYLAIQNYEFSDLADPLFSRALSFVAIYKGITGKRLSNEESLLSYSLGYIKDAKKISEDLSENNLIRLFVENEYETLFNGFDNKNSSDIDKYLIIKSFSLLNKKKEWKRFGLKFKRDKRLSLAVFGTLLNFHNFSLDPKSSGILINLVYEKLSEILSKYSESSIKNKLIKKDLISFENLLNFTSKNFNNKFVSPSEFSSFYRNYFYFAIFTLGRYYIYNLSSPTVAQKFINKFGRSCVEKFSCEYIKWYNALIQYKKGNIRNSEFYKETGFIDSLPVYYHNFALERLGERAPFADPLILSAVKNIVKKMDTRSEFLYLMMSYDYNYLLNLEETEKLSEVLIKTSPDSFPYAVIIDSLLHRSSAKIFKLLESPTVTPYYKAKALSGWKYYKDVSIDHIDKEFKKLINANPESYEYVKAYADFLVKNGKKDNAKTIILRWLKMNKNKNSFDYIFARTRLAELYYNDGEYIKAVKVVSPVASTMQGNAMAILAKSYYAAGNRKKAVAIVKTIIKRYPDSKKGRAMLAGFYWKNGEYEKAAEVISASPVPINFNEWNNIILPEFTQSMKNRDDNSIITAFSSLIRGIFDSYPLILFVDYYNNKGRTQLAYKLLSVLPLRGQAKFAYLIELYKILKKSKGQSFAVHELKRELPRQYLNILAIFAYDMKSYDLLWTPLFKRPPAGRGREYTWLLKTAVYLMNKVKYGDGYKELLSHYSQGQNKKYYYLIGRYLIGKTPEKKVIKLAGNMKQLCEIAYFIGLKAESEKNFIKAARWYRISLLTGLKKNGEYRWSYVNLAKWRNELLSLRLK